MYAKRIIALLLAWALAAQSTLPSWAQANFWSERRSALTSHGSPIQLAALTPALPPLEGSAQRWTASSERLISSPTTPSSSLQNRLIDSSAGRLRMDRVVKPAGPSSK